MNALHDKVLTDVKKLAQENIYLKGQENRIPKIDIKLPKEGQIFKSEDLLNESSDNATNKEVIYFCALSFLTPFFISHWESVYIIS